MPAQENTKQNQEYQPTAVQIERIAALRRFNRLYIYTPILLMSLLILTLTGLLLWGSLSPYITGTRVFASALADLIIIFVTIPMLLLCLVVPLGVFGFALYRRQAQKDGPPHGRLQRVFWRIDTLITKLHTQIEKNLPRMVKPVIQVNAILAYIHTLISQIMRILRRS